MRLLCIMTLLITTGCVGAPASTELAQPAPHFSPRRFFTGSTEGRGLLLTMMPPQKTVVVQGSGRAEGEASVVLDQSIERTGSKISHREWRLTETSPDRYSGTLTDATGPVSGVVTGNDFHVHYRIKGGMTVDQHLYLQPGEAIVLNRMAFRKMGIVVARMNETIRRTP